MKSMLTILICVCFFTLTINAQFSAGAALLYGTESDLGFNLRGEYDINENISVVLGYSRLDKQTVGTFSTTSSSIDLEGHYHFEMEVFRPYVLAGISNFRVSSKINGIKTSGSNTGVNLGGGINKLVADNINVFGEAKYTIVDGGDQFILLAGGKYSF